MQSPAATSCAATQCRWARRSAVRMQPHSLQQRKQRPPQQCCLVGSSSSAPTEHSGTCRTPTLRCTQDRVAGRAAMCQSPTRAHIHDERSPQALLLYTTSSPQLIPCKTPKTLPGGRWCAQRARCHGKAPPAVSEFESSLGWPGTPECVSLAILKVQTAATELC